MCELLNYVSKHQPSKAFSVSPIPQSRTFTCRIEFLRFHVLNVLAHISPSLREPIVNDVPRNLALDTNVFLLRPVLWMVECPDVNNRVGIVFVPRVYWRPAVRTEATLCPRR